MMLGTNASVILSDSDPEDLGVKSPGTSFSVARGDHVHKMPSASDVGAIPSQSTDKTYAYPSAYSTFAEIKADIDSLKFTNGARAIISIDSGHTVAEQFIFENGDYGHVWIQNGARTSIRNATYQWTQIGATNEYFLELAGGGDPSISEPAIVRLAENDHGRGSVPGVKGSLVAGGWCYGASGTGFNTIIIRTLASADPDTLAEDSITYENKVALTTSGFSAYHAGILFNTPFTPLLVYRNCGNAPVLDCRFDGNRTANTGTYDIGALVEGSIFRSTPGAGLDSFYYNNILPIASVLHCNFIRMLDCGGNCFTPIGSSVYAEGAVMSSGVSGDVVQATGSHCSFRNATATAAGNGSCFHAAEASVFDCLGATGTESGSGYGFRVTSGGYINANSATGSLSQTKNVVAATGLIYQA